MADEITGMAEVWKTGDVDGVHGRAFVDARMMEIHLWCATEQAQRLAGRLIHRSRLPLEADDLLGEVLVRVVTTIERRPERFEEFVAAAYCTTVMKNLAASWWSRRPDMDLVPPADLEARVPSRSTSRIPTVEAEDIDRFRTIVEALGGDGVHVSAAITMTYLSAFDDIVVDDAPWPKAGVAGDRRVGWPALWYATRNAGLFPDSTRHGRDRQARTRQRQLERIDALCVKARLAMNGTVES